MKREWTNANVEELEVRDTQFGPYNENNPDSDKTAVKDANGEILGWEQEFGEASGQ